MLERCDLHTDLAALLVRCCLFVHCGMFLGVWSLQEVGGVGWVLGVLCFMGMS